MMEFLCILQISIVDKNYCDIEMIYTVCELAPQSFQTKYISCCLCYTVSFSWQFATSKTTPNTFSIFRLI